MKSTLAEVIAMLNNEDSSIQVRAVNAVSSLENVTQLHWLEPYQRVAIWQRLYRSSNQ
ncbi:UPF0147 family protein [Candidatus Nitrososphaera gargensis]|uniref:UPF0147 family protein n=1 Tax=Candidatus Nitrososphaera gargensis TaxID=497727 RepID=UPI0011E510B2